MCGFIGYFGNKNIDLEGARKIINHRGPDMHGTQIGSEWKVAFNRLSINDLTEKGMQPFKHEGITVYMNGEIFNFLELLEEHKKEFFPKSRSDAEILPFLYKKYGLKFLNMLNGMFAIILIDEIKNKKYLIRDRFGEKPLYYKHCESTLFFSSEVKALKKVTKLEIDKINIQINFACWFLPQPLTLYKGTYNINPGSYIEYYDGKIKEYIWYQPKIITKKLSRKEIEDKFIELYKSSIKLRLRSDVPVGVFLSGGLDSTSIMKFSNEFDKKNVSAFTSEILDKEVIENNLTDVVIPKKLTNDLDIQSHSIKIDYNYFNENIVSIIKNYDEIFINSGVLVFYQLSKLAKENHTKVVLTGVGGDELFGGYPWQSGVVRKINFIFKKTYNQLRHNNFLCNLFNLFGRKFSTVYQILFDYKVWHAQSLSSFRYDIKKNKKIIDKKIRDKAEKYFDYSTKNLDGDNYNIMNFANTFTVIGAGNYFIDLAAMQNSIENRSPFLDYRLFEFLMSIADDVKSEQGNKGLMRDILKNFLPTYVIDAKKSGSTMPIQKWFYNSNINNIKNFIFKYKNCIDEYLGLKIKLNDNWIKNPENSLKLFAIICFIIWIKFNVFNDIENENISFDELIKT